MADKYALEMAERYCKENGLILEKGVEWNDAGVSGFRGKNRTQGALSRFLVAIRSGQVKEGSVLLIENQDRMSREPIHDVLGLVTEILSAGVDIAILTSGKIYKKESLNGAQALTQIIWEAERAHQESVRKSQLLGDAWRNKRVSLREHGTKLTKNCPGWLKYDEASKKFVGLPGRVKIVKAMFDMALDGSGDEKITKTLNKKGMHSWRGGIWHQNTVRHTLTNRAVLGEFQPHRWENGKKTPDGEPIRGYFPAIIDQGIFDGVRAKRQTPLMGPREGRINNLFTGLIRCGHCGGSMVYVDKGKHWRYLVCYNAMMKKAHTCSRMSFRYDKFENSFLGWCKQEIAVPNLFTNEQDKKLAKGIQQARTQAQALEFQVGEAKAKIKRLMDSFSESGNKTIRENFDEMIIELGEKVTDLKRKHEEKLAEIGTMTQAQDTIKDKIFSLSQLEGNNRIKTDPVLRSQVRETIRDIVDRIILYPEIGMVDLWDSREGVLSPQGGWIPNEKNVGPWMALYRGEKKIPVVAHDPRKSIGMVKKDGTKRDAIVRQGWQYLVRFKRGDVALVINPPAPLPPCKKQKNLNRFLREGRDFQASWIPAAPA
jgi:hypothetical protein